MAHLIVHAGFHKTGTTTVQKTLRRNRPLLRPHMGIILRGGMKPLCEAARGYSATRDPLDLALVTYEAAALAETLNRAKPVILSSEDLCGHMPGRKDLKTFAAAPTLLSTIMAAFAEVMPRARLDVMLSTRAAEPWLKSCHAQNVRTVRMALNLRDYSRIFRKSADLDGIIDQIRDKTPQALVHRHPLELGTALTPLLTLAGVPADVQRQITTVPPANTALPDDALDRLLALHQSDLDDATWKAERLKLMGKAP